MCGIFGMIGQNSVSSTVDALKLLEYRGYDSVGIATKDQDLALYKCVGRVENLKQILPNQLHSCVTIGHTRWATHGAVCLQNAHPFLSPDGHFAIVHNGILQNFLQLKSNLSGDFSSTTDSECIAHLLQKNYNGCVKTCILQVANLLKGSFAVVVASAFDNKLYAIRHQSPLVVGFGQNSSCFCSDVRCIAHFANSVAIVPEDTVVELSQESANFFAFDGASKQVEFFAPQKEHCLPNDQSDFMLKEMWQIPQKIAVAKQNYLQNALSIGKNFVKKLKRIYFVGCGTAYHAGLQTMTMVRKFFDVDLHAVVASEFLCDNYLVDEHTLAFCISQSGETADTLRAVEKINALGGFTYAVTNTSTSTLANLCKSVVNIGAGGEFAVASTKAYNCQLVCLLLLCLDLAKARRTIDQATYRILTEGVDKLPSAVNKVLANAPFLQQISQQIKNSTAVFYLGRAIDYPTASEGSLKLKEISYIHSESYPAGELKHGTLALMESGVSVVAICTQYHLLEKMQSTVSEVVARGANVVALSPYHLQDAQNVVLPVVNELLYPILSVVPLQLVAYYTAKALGRDVDKPRNLAKSVTVE